MFHARWNVDHFSLTRLQFSGIELHTNFSLKRYEDLVIIMVMLTLLLPPDFLVNDEDSRELSDNFLALFHDLIMALLAKNRKFLAETRKIKIPPVRILITSQATQSRRYI
jgi:hypothetical protein